MTASESDSNLDLSWLNSLSDTHASEQFLKCCGSHNWTRRMAESGPFESVGQLCSMANAVWWDLTEDDWLEAFRSHPRIGERKAAAEVSTQALDWSNQEQAAVRNTAKQTLDELARLNRAYEKKFGYIFIVCATGKSSEEMLETLKSRIGNDPKVELRIAAGEQAKITEIRLRKLLNC